MGVPEKFAQVDRLLISRSMRQRSSSPKVVVVYDWLDSHQSVSTNRDLLGYQFVLGIIPVTRLYLERGTRSMIREQLADLLQLRGYDVVETGTLGLPTASAQFNPELILRVSEPAPLSAKVYDTLFLRLIAISGAIKIQRLGHASTERPLAINEITALIDETKPTLGGHAPEVAAALEHSLQASLEPALDSLETNQLRATRLRPGLFTDPVPPNRPASAILITPPRLETKLDADLGQQFALSYGFSSTPPLCDKSLQRIVQLGIEQGVQSANRPAITLLSAKAAPQPSAETPAAQDGVCILSSSIADLRIDDGKLLLSMTLANSDVVPSSTIISCSATVSPLSDRDGAWIATLTEIARSATLYALDLKAFEESLSIQGIRCTRAS